MKISWIIILSAIAISSCVSKEQHAVLQSNFEAYKKEADKSEIQFKKEIDTLNKQLNNSQGDKRMLEDQIKTASSQIESLEGQYNGLLETNSVLESNYNALLASSSNRNQKLFQQLGAKEKMLEEKEDTLIAKLNRIDRLQATLDERQARVIELEGIIARQDSVAQALKQKIKDVLYQFNDDQVKVKVKNGKVYVSLSNEILFKSGSIDVDSTGVSAIRLLAKVLNINPDIEVNIEGHTDTDKGLDNWDLSVKRATSIVKILTAGPNAVDPVRITASGRGEFQPVEDNATSQGKAKNRRIEVILTPNLDAIYNVLDEM